MKKSIAVLIALMLAVLALVPLGASADITMVKVTKGASIRSTAGFNGDKLQMAKVGEEYLYLGTEGSWYAVQVNADTKGYLPKDSGRLVTAPGVPTGSVQEAYSNLVSTLKAGAGLEKAVPETFNGKSVIAVYYDLGNPPEEYSTELLADSGSYWSVPDSLLAAKMDEADWALLVYPTVTIAEDADPIQVNVFAVDVKNNVYYAPYNMDDRATVLANDETSFELDSTLRGMEEFLIYPKLEREIELASDKDYQLGLQLMSEGKYYSAYEAFGYSSAEEALTMAEKCVQAWPKNGEIWHNPSAKGSKMELTVKVNQDSDRAMLVKLIKSGVEVAYLFIGGTGSATAKLPAGTYVIKDGVGTRWFGKEEAFGREGSYETMTFGDNDQAEVTLQNGHAYTITINVTNPDPEAEGVGSEYEDYDNF